MCTTIQIILATIAFCNTDGTSVTYAPDALSVPYLVTNIIWHVDEEVDPPIVWAETNILTRYRATLHPSTEDYLKCGWYKNGIEPPNPPTAMFTGKTAYEVVDDRVIAKYTYFPIPVAIPRYSVADLFFFCKLKNKETQIDELLKSAGYYTVAVTTKEVEGNNEIFDAVIEAVKSSGIFTTEEISEALAYALID